MDQMQNYNIPEEDEIDLVALIKKLWLNRGLIIICTCVFMVLGLVVALVTPKVFTASCDVVPQTSSGTSTKSQMSMLAKMAGINISQELDTKTLSPYVYENIMKSTKFRKELMQTKIKFAEVEQPVSFFEYYTSEEYNKPSVIDYIKKYAIGLPGVILGAIRGEQPAPDYSALGGEGSQIETTTK